MRNTLSAPVAITSVAVAVACLSGCGSSHPAKNVTAQALAASPCPAGQSACVTTDPAEKVVGSQNLTDNLRAAVVHDHKELSDVSLTCRNTTGFPKLCTMTALWSLKGEPTVPVAGELRAFGVYTRTHTYAFQVVYHQTGGPRLHKRPEHSQTS